LQDDAKVTRVTVFCDSCGESCAYQRTEDR